LNTPYYWTGGNPLIKTLRPDHQHAVDYYTESIGHIYFSSRPPDEDIPNEKRLCESVDEYFNRNSNKFSDLIDKVSRKDTLTVHVRSGDRGVIVEHIVDIITSVSKNYDKIFILSGVHSDSNWFSSIDQPKENLKNSLDKLKNIFGDKLYFDFSDADVHLCLMRHCSNLLLHMGGFSMLGGLLFQGENLYIPPYFEPKDKPAYMDHLNPNSKKIFL
jgi:hypothetical protein